MRRERWATRSNSTHARDDERGVRGVEWSSKVTIIPQCEQRAVQVINVSHLHHAHPDVVMLYLSELQRSRDQSCDRAVRRRLRVWEGRTAALMSSAHPVCCASWSSRCRLLADSLQLLRLPPAPLRLSSSDRIPLHQRSALTLPKSAISWTAVAADTRQQLRSRFLAAA